MKNWLKLFILCFVSSACHSGEPAAPENADVEEARTPVTVTTISTGTLSDSLELNATSIFQQDNIVASTLNGYIKALNIKPGQYVTKGKNLFVLKSKESESLGNTINSLDPSFRFTGVVNVNASQNGYVVQLFHQTGDYVQDGEQLAILANTNSFAFVLNIPYEYRRFVSVGKEVNLTAPDGTRMTGNIYQFLPGIDSVSQTQTAVIHVNSKTAIPENLIVKVKLLKEAREQVNFLPKQAILADEAQTEFWVMKLIDTATAVKVDIQKGIEREGKVEIISPHFGSGDKIILSGNYGLSDTAKVKVMGEKE